MLLVIPVSGSDKKLIPAFVKGFENFHPGNGHKLLVVGNPSVETEVRTVESTLSAYFDKTASYITQYDNPNGWPMAMNDLFFNAAVFVGQNYGPEDAFLWMELDSAPLKEGWLSTISKTYFNDAIVAQSEGREMNRYLGAETITRESRNGEILPTSETGTHMAACGVYPFDVAQRIRMLNVTPKILKAFYEYVQWPIVTNLQKTKLIQHNWMTRNYREENGQIVSDSANRLAYMVDYNEPVNPEAVLLHGVKDGSLQYLLGGKEPAKILEPKKEEKAAAQVEQIDPSKKLVQVFTRDPVSGRMYGEEITQGELDARIAEEQRQAQKELERQIESASLAKETKELLTQAVQKMENSPENVSSTIKYELPEEVFTPNIPVKEESESLTEQEVSLNDSGLEDAGEQEDSEDTPSEETPATAKPRRKKRGPGRPKKQKRNISPERREALKERMRLIGLSRAGKPRDSKQTNG